MLGDNLGRWASQCLQEKYLSLLVVSQRRYKGVMANSDLEAFVNS